MNELTKRTLSAAVLGILVLWLLFNSIAGFAIIVAIAAIIMGYEFARLRAMKISSLTLVLAFAGSVFYLGIEAKIPQQILYLLLGLAAIFWLKNLFLVLNYPRKKPKNTEFFNAINLFFLLLSLSFLPLLQQFPSAELLLLLLIVWAADIFAYFTGKMFGKHKLAPNVSAGKTVEGLAGGLFAALLATGGWAFATDNLGYEYLLLGLATGAISVVGDLYASIYKREAGVKDSGAILPGHGGIFDRLDGLLAAAPIFFIGLELLR